MTWGVSGVTLSLRILGLTVNLSCYAIWYIALYFPQRVS